MGRFEAEPVFFHQELLLRAALRSPSPSPSLVPHPSLDPFSPPLIFLYNAQACTRLSRAGEVSSLLLRLQ